MFSQNFPDQECMDRGNEAACPPCRSFAFRPDRICLEAAACIEDDDDDRGFWSMSPVLMEVEVVGGRDSSSSSSINASPLVNPMRARFGDRRVKGDARDAGDGAGEGDVRSEFFESSYPISAKFLLEKGRGKGHQVRANPPRTPRPRSTCNLG